MTTLEKFDDIVFGGGKGGKSLAAALASAGHKVAMIEKGMIGGSCINVACIPTKTMVRSARLLHDARHSSEFGIELSVPTNTLRGIIERKRRVVQSLVDMHWQLFKSTENLSLIVGKGRFTAPKEIEVEQQDGTTRKLSADRIYINTGTRTMVPDIPGLKENGYLTSTSIMELDELPDHLVIIGGGYIGLEFAQIFKRLGSRVTVLVRGDRFLPKEDKDIAEAIKEVLVEEGIDIRTNANPQRIEKQGPNELHIVMSESVPGLKQDGATISGPASDTRQVSATKSGATTEVPRSAGTAVGTATVNNTVSADAILVAIGRTPNTTDINLEAAGIKTDKRGYITVNSKLETNVPGVWALGDCNGGPHFTHVSWDDFRIVRDNVLHQANRTTDGRLVPYTLFIDPELGRVGMTEEEARQKGFNVAIAKLPAVKVPRAVTSGHTRGVLKAVIDRDSNKILGCSIFANEGGEVMSVLQVAMLGGLPYTTIRDTIFTHPTMAESLNLLFSSVH